MQLRKKDNSPRAYYNQFTNTSQILITESSSATGVDKGRHGTSARAGHNPWARVDPLSCIRTLWSAP